MKSGIGVSRGAKAPRRLGGVCAIGRTQSNPHCYHIISARRGIQVDHSWRLAAADKGLPSEGVFAARALGEKMISDRPKCRSTNTRQQYAMNVNSSSLRARRERVAAQARGAEHFRRHGVSGRLSLVGRGAWGYAPVPGLNQVGSNQPGHRERRCELREEASLFLKLTGMCFAFESSWNL